MPFDILEFTSPLLQTLGVLLWFVVPFFLIALFWQLRLVYKRQLFLEKQKWDMLEVRIPREVIKRPKAMEQVFSGLYGIYSFGIKWIDRYLEGKVDLWISFEIVAKGGGIQFFIRTPSQFRNLVESSIYGQYPGAEILDAEDYTQELPESLPNEKFDIWGTSYILNKEGPYPIRTYKDFDEFEIDDEKRIDPLSAMYEAMSKLKGNERIWIQYMISPTGAPTGVDIKKEADDIIKKIVEDNTKVEGETGGRKPLTHGTQEIIKGIENKVSKHVFQISFRFIYCAPKDEFNPLNTSSIMGSFQQFNTQNMNGFRPDIRTLTVFGGWLARFFPKYKSSRILTKKRMLYDAYVHRRFGLSNRLSDSEKLPVLSSEELATIYHYPIVNVKAPQLQRIGSRRAEPPVNLPVE